MIDFAAIRAAPRQDRPYPFLVVPNAIDPARARRIAEDFPPIDTPGSVDVREAAGGPAFDSFRADLLGDELRQAMAEKFGIDLDGKPVVLNARGVMRAGDGNIHTDVGRKLITLLFYFNEGEVADRTALRILNSPNSLDDAAAIVPAGMGTMVAFAVTPDCWHGHHSITGRRLSLQMNYVTGEARRGKHEGLARTWRRLKRKLGVGGY